MRKPSIADTVRKRLLREGFSRGYANRAARELTEHWHDLVDESLRQGHSIAEAEAYATSQLGATEPLGQEFATRLRNSSWLGRNPTAGFTILAIVTTYIWWAILVLAASSVSGLYDWDSKNPKGPLPNFELFRASVDWIRSISYVGIPFLICFIAQRYRCGWKPALWGCLMVAIHNAMHFFTMDGPNPAGGGSVAWGYSFNMRGPDLLPIITPIGIFLIFLLWRLRPEPADESSNLQSS